MIIDTKLANQTLSLRETLATKESLNELQENLKTLIYQLRFIVDGGDSQGGLVGKFNQLDKKIDNNFNQLNNTLTSHTTSLNDLNTNQNGLVDKFNQLDKKIDNNFNQLNNILISHTTSLDDLNTTIKGKDGLVGEFKELNKKIEEQKLWQITPLVAVFLGIVGFAFFVRTTTVDGVKVKLEPKFDKIDTELVNIKRIQQNDFNKVNTELNNIKTTQQQILDKLNNF